MSRSAAEKPFYLPELDVLRAFAFLAVFCHHWMPGEASEYVGHGMSRSVATALTALSWTGANGVRLFFCLSSYLITQLLFKEIAACGRLGVRAFYMRRVLRIWPLYVTFTALALVLAAFDHDQTFGWKAGLAFILFSGNWIFVFKSLYVNTVALAPWSVSVEEQFYLCWPWLVRRATKQGLTRAVIGLFVIAALKRLLVITRVVDMGLWHNTFTALDSIGLGALMAVSSNARLERLRDKRRFALMIGAIVALFLVQYLRGESPSAPSNFVYYPLSALATAGVLYAFIGISIDPQAPVMRALIYLGKISYGLYVVHLFAFYSVNKVLARLPFKLGFVVRFGVVGLTALALSVVLAAISYRWLERPFLRLKRRFEPAARQRRDDASDKAQRAAA